MQSNKQQPDERMIHLKFYTTQYVEDGRTIDGPLITVIADETNNKSKELVLDMYKASGLFPDNLKICTELVPGIEEGPFGADPEIIFEEFEVDRDIWTAEDDAALIDFHSVVL